jgi:hypothetical protein
MHSFLAKYAKSAKYTKFINKMLSKHVSKNDFAYFAYFAYFVRKRLIA